MKMVCISDSHNLADRLQIPEGDVLVHAGDFTQGGTKVEFERFAKWLAGLTHKHVVVIAGNHDWFAGDSPALARKILTDARENVHYLHDESVLIDGIKLYGSPYQPTFFNWCFNLERGPEIAAKWEEIPDDTDILITHGPPSCIGDLVSREGSLATENVGCRDLSRRIEKLSKLKTHVCGHIHDGHGLRTINGVHYVNASVLNDRYQIAYNPIVLDL